MGIIDGIKKMAGKLMGGSSTSTFVTGRKITSEAIKYIGDLSNFSDMDEEDVYEQLYVWDVEAGGSIDRLGTLVARSFKSFYVKTDVELTPKEKRMMEILEDMQVRPIFESFVETLIMRGNLYIDRRKPGIATILPNKYVSFIEKQEQLQQSIAGQVLTQPNFMYMYELPTDVTVSPELIEKWAHIKYKDTPVFSWDNMHRKTFGMYSPSPLHRAILPVWWKRQTMIIDIMMRWRNVPREHHKLDSSMFDLKNYRGTVTERAASAKTDAEATIDNYVEKLKSQTPDQGYVSLDTVTIENKESNIKYTSPNDLLSQLNSETYNALNVPESMVNSTKAGSYASELVVSNYVTEKVLDLAEKVRPIILQIIRERLLLIDDTLPVDKLRIELELVLAMSRMELFRQAAIMATLGIFTETELREMLGWENLTDDQREFIVRSGRGKTGDDVVRDVSRESPINPPQTNNSDDQHDSDPGQNVGRDIR